MTVLGRNKWMRFRSTQREEKKKQLLKIKAVVFRQIANHEVRKPILAETAYMEKRYLALKLT